MHASIRLPAVAVVVALLAGLPGRVAGEEAVPPREVLELRVEYRQLVLYTRLPATGGEEMREVAVRGFGGPVGLMIEAGEGHRGRARRNGGAWSPWSYKLEYGDDERVAGERTAMQVYWHDGSLHVQRSTYFTGEHRYTRLVRLVSSALPRDADDGAGAWAAWAAGAPRRSVQLSVGETGNVGGRPPLRVDLRAADFFTLLRKHPREAEQFIRPMMRELGQEQVFSPEAPLAWQVFADRWEPPAGLRKRVDELLAALDADDPAAREDASLRLAELGRDGALAVMRLDRSGLSAEQNTRLDAHVAKHAPIPPAEAEKLRSDVPFLLDCLDSSDERLREAALERLRKVTGQPVELDVKLDGAARAAAVAALRRKLTGPANAP